MASCWFVRRATPQDVAAIVAIQQVCPGSPLWSRAIWVDVTAGGEHAHPARVCLVAEAAAGILGFVVASCTSELAELESVAVVSSARCQGIGRNLCEAVMNWSRGRGARSMELEVRASSRGALALYNSLGFAEQGRRPGYYRDPAEDAVLMAAALQIEASLDVPGAQSAEM